MIVRVNKKNGFDLYDCDGLKMTELDKDLVEFRLYSYEQNMERGLVTIEIGKNVTVYVMNNAGQTVTKYCT